MHIQIQIDSFENFNPRKDRAAHSWYRMQNNWYDDPKLFGCDIFVRYCYSCLLGHAQNERLIDVMTLDVEWFAHKITMKVAQTSAALEKLHENQLIKIVGHQSVTTGNQDTIRGHTTNERTNEQMSGLEKPHDDVKKYSPNDSDLLRCYAAYPRKDHKKQFLTRAKNMFTKPEHLENFTKAIENYKRYLIKNEVDGKHTKLITSFMTNWEEWLERGTGNTTLKVVGEVWKTLDNERPDLEG